jgi:hypothetical protein
VRTVRSIPRKHRCLHRQLKQAIPYVIHALFGVAGASLSRALVPASLGSSRSSCRALSSSSSCAAKLRNDELCKCCKISSQTSLSSTPYGVITLDVSHYMKSPIIPWKYFDRSLKAFEVLVCVFLVNCVVTLYRTFSWDARVQARDAIAIQKREQSTRA